MNQNTEQDLKDLVHDFAQDVKDGIKIASDITAIIQEHSVTAVLSLLEVDFPNGLADVCKSIVDFPNGLADVCKSIADFIRTEHDVLPSGKSKATLSNGEVLEMKYYETPDTFQARINKEEALIAKQ
jgi:hypothetical protein